ncbi:MAG: response regulator [Candidatus Acidiferrales bacterium]
MKARILVVEDNRLNCELLCDWLEAEGFDVHTADTLKKAFTEFENHPPDAVLLDVELGSEDGLALARWIREQPNLRHIPVIAVTAHAMLTDQKRVMEAGCNSCISKPVDFKLLSEQLAQWLNRSANL